MDIKDRIIVLNKELESAKNTVWNLEKQIDKLQEECKHEDLEISKFTDAATCKICNKRFVWYCPTSPTLECDYEQEDGSYDEDCCRYCGQPEERK